MTTPAIFNQVKGAANQAANLYTNLYNNFFNNINGVTPAELNTAYGTNAGLYFTMMNNLKATANGYDNTIIATGLQTYPNNPSSGVAYVVTINGDGTVTLS